MGKILQISNAPAIDFPIENVIPNSILVIKLNEQMPIHGTITIDGILKINGALIIRS